MDLLLTLGIIYLTYRGYQWYSRLQQQVQSGTNNPLDISQKKDNEEDYIDYEEVE